MERCEIATGATPLERRRPSKKFVDWVIEQAGGEHTIFAKTLRQALGKSGVTYEDVCPDEIEYAEVSGEQGQRALDNYEELKAALEKLPDEEVILTDPNILNRPCGPFR